MKIKRINLIDLMYWDTVTRAWRPLYAKDPATGTEQSLGPSADHCVSLYMATSGGDGLAPDAPYNYGINWRRFDVLDQFAVSEDWTIFDSEEPTPDTRLLPFKAKSVRIRYKLSMTDDADPANTYTPSQYYYQIVNGAYPTDHITYTGTITTGPFAPTVYVKLPGISNNMVPYASSLFSWLTNARNWSMEWKHPDDSIREYIPSTVSIQGIYESDDPNFDGAYINMKLVFPTLMVGQSGTHTLTISVLPNDQETGGFHVFADKHTWTAVITAYEPSMADPLLMSFDDTLFMSIWFNQVTGP